STTLQLRDLTLDDSELGDEGVEALAASPVLASVEVLCLRQNSIRVRGIRALAASPHLGRLRSLSAYDNPLGDPGGEALADAVWLEGIESLSLERCGLGAGAARALLGVPPPGLARLGHLGLFGNTEELMAVIPELRERFGDVVSLS